MPSSTETFVLYEGFDESRSVEGVVLAFDFGTKKIGVAAGQTLTKTSSPLAALSAKDGVPNWEELTLLINRWRPSALIVGVPFGMDGSEEPITKKAKRFAKRLKSHFGSLPVFGMDERLTTYTARQELFEQGGRKLIKKYSIDSVAAQLILESWLRQFVTD
jgi:putative Holliday junction resolvase